MKKISNLWIISCLFWMAGLVFSQEKPSLMLCVAGDNLNMRSEPQAKSPVVKQLFWLQQFYVSDTGVKEKIGGETHSWYRLYAARENMDIDESGPRSLGYAYGKFLLPCEKVKPLFDEKMKKAKTLKEKLLWRKIAYVRFFPDGKSEKYAFEGGCCMNTVKVQGHLTWKEKKDGIEVDFYQMTINIFEGNETPEETKELIQERFLIKDIRYEKGEWVLVTDKEAFNFKLESSPHLYFEDKPSKL